MLSYLPYNIFSLAFTTIILLSVFPLSVPILWLVNMSDHAPDVEVLVGDQQSIGSMTTRSRNSKSSNCFTIAIRLLKALCMDHTRTSSHEKTDFQFVTWFRVHLVLLRAIRALCCLQATDTPFMILLVVGNGLPSTFNVDRV